MIECCYMLDILIDIDFLENAMENLSRYSPELFLFALFAILLMILFNVSVKKMKESFDSALNAIKDNYDRTFDILTKSHYEKSKNAKNGKHSKPDRKE